MKEKTLHMIGNAHIDPVWLWQWPEGFHEVKATFRSALDRMNEYDDFVFVSSSAAFYEWVEKSEPAMFEEIRQRIAEGRWRVVGGWWIQPDCNLPGGESFVRQALYGQNYFKKKFGVTATVGYNVDSFGHNGMLPQLLKKSGLDYYIFLRPMPHEKGLPGSLFWWEADDGSRVLAFRIPYEYCTGSKELQAHVRRCLAGIKAPFDASMCFYGVGNHGGGPTKENLDSIHQMAADPEFPVLAFSWPEKMFQSLPVDDLPIPVVHDDLQHHASGCYAAHSGVKRWNRRAENALLAAEKFSAIAAWMVGQPYPEDFDLAWKNVLFNQFHDVLAGTSIEPAYEDARDMYGETMSIARRGLNFAIQALAWNVRLPDEQEGLPFLVFNPNTWDSHQNVELELGRLPEDHGLFDEHGKAIPFQRVRSMAAANGRNRIAFTAGLPSLGYRTFWIRPQAGAEFQPVLAGDDFMENERFLFEIDPEKGAIRRLYDKLEEVEVFSGPAALPVILEDSSDTWSHNVFQFDRVLGTFSPRSVRLVEQGPVKAVLRVVSEYQRSTLVQEFTLYSGLDLIEVQVTVDWHEQFKALKLRFPVNLSHMRATYEIPYGHKERFANGEEEPGQSWVDLSGLARDSGSPYGLSLLNDGKYSFDVNIRDIGMTVLRSPIFAHHIPFEAGVEDSFIFIDQGPQRFKYALLPHAGNWEGAGTVKRAAELNQPPVTLVGTFHPEGSLPQSDSFLTIDRENVVATVLKQAEESEDLVLRCVEMNKEAAVATILLPRWDRMIEASFGPCEIKTFRIPKDPSRPVIETNLLEWSEPEGE